ncbi:740_t:CDS:10, partial [Diversispora eburnea]
GIYLSPELKASLYERFMFSWVNPLISKGFRKTLEKDDVFELPYFLKAKYVVNSFHKTQRPSYSFLKSLFLVLRKDIIIQFFYSIAWSIITALGPPYALKKILLYVQNYPNNEMSQMTAYMYVFGLFLGVVIPSFCFQQALIIGRQIGAIIIGEIYLKSLSRKDTSGVTNDEESKNKTGKITNLMAVDTTKISEISAYIFYIYSFPIQIILSIIFLYDLLGISALAGVLTIIITYPLPALINQRFATIQKRLMEATDKRMSLLQAIRIIKFFAWENQFRTKVNTARENELKELKNRLMQWVYMGNLWMMLPLLIMLSELTATIAFTSLALFNNLRHALDEIPATVIAFIQESEIKRLDTRPSSINDPDIGFVDATFQWPDGNDSTEDLSSLSSSSTDSSATATDNIITNPLNKFTLKNINTAFPIGELSLICGPTGCGKTSLLMALLGEMECVSGRTFLPRNNNFEFLKNLGGAPSGIAYVAQTAWIQNATIRDNILFGLPYKEEKLNKVIQACDLTRDLEIFEFGDKTEVGEKGITLSGGQKQRIALARAVYSQANVIIMDDCLSAVDSHTAKHIFEQCLMGDLMKNRTRILVTHHVGLCLRGASKVVVMRDGQIIGEGSADKVLNEDGDDVIDVKKKVCNQNDGKLILDETKAEGTVEWKVYKTYLIASGGFIFWIVLIIMFILNEAFQVDWWIREWTKAYSDVDIVAYYMFMGSLAASKSLHTAILEKILSAKIRFFDTTPIGRIMNRFSKDMETIDQNLSPVAMFLLYSCIATASVIFVISGVMPSFLIAGVFIAALYVAIGAYYIATSRDLKRLESISRSPIYAVFGETIIGVSTIRAFGAEKRLMTKMLNLVNGNSQPFIFNWACNRWLHIRVDVAGGLVSLATGIIVLYSLKTGMDPGLAGFALTYAINFTAHVIWVLRMYAVQEMNMNSVERVQEYLALEEEPPRIIDYNRPPPNWPPKGEIHVKDLVMQYAPDNPPVLKNISFHIRPAEKVGIVGRTGSGKSTLAISFFRFMEPISGQIIIDDVDISTIGLFDLRSRLTIIPQDPVLFTGTLRSNLDSFGEYDDEELWNALRRAHLIEGDSLLLNQENGNNFSQGQRQLIALARALVRKSKLIIMDEATASVDFKTDRMIQETIRQEFSDATLLCIAHHSGKIVEYDHPYVLLQKEDSVFRGMCDRSGEFAELLEISSKKYQNDKK